MNDHITAEELAAYVDGLLTDAKKNELENHFLKCPACLDELADITAIMHGRQGKTPGEFLAKALGEIKRTSRPVQQLRPVFEAAAVLLVVVLIGYLLLDNRHFWQIPEQQKPSVIMKKNLRPEDTSVFSREKGMVPLPAKQAGRADAQKENNERAKADVDQRLADSLTSEKRTSSVAVAGSPAAKAGSGQVHELQDEKLRTVSEKESLEKKEIARTTAIAETVDQVQLNFSAKDKQTHLPVRIEGDAAQYGLRNPEILIAWTWFQKGLILELKIDGNGLVTKVLPLGKFDQSLARQAENEAKKLLFCVSKKKIRRARLLAN